VGVFIEMNRIYVLGTMDVNLPDNSGNSPGQIIKHQRLWYFFAHFKDAEECVLQNQSNIFEYYYNLALIEEHYVYDPTDKSETPINWGMTPQWWYQATFHPEPTDQLQNPTVRKIEQPACFKNICNFWAG
jgi:hypothetical protein